MRKIISTRILLFLIILLGIFLRFFKLSDYPIQLNHDEITQLYDAISIAKTGKDVYGNFLPFIFPSIGDFKPPFYTYMTSFFYLIFGGGEMTIRFTSSIFGVFIIPAVYFFASKLFKNNIVALFAAFLTSVAPFEIFFSRKSFENGAGIFFMLLGFTYFLIGINKKSQTKFFYLASILFGITSYTYFSHAVILPILLIVFILIYRKYFLENFKLLMLPFVCLLIFLLPLVFLIITNSDTRFRSRTVFLTQDVNLGRAIDYSKVNNPYIDFLTRNKAILDFSFNRYLNQFNVVYLFANGLDFTNQGIMGIGPLLLTQIPFLVLGILNLIVLKGFTREKKFILAWILLGTIPSGLTFEEHSPHRSVMVFTMLNIISAVGLYYFFEFLKNFNKKYKAIKILTSFIITIAFGINLLYFFHMYFVNFPYEKSQYIQYPFKQISLFAWSQYNNFDSIVLDPQFGKETPIIGVGAHYYLAYYGNYDPAKFQKEYKIGDKSREVIFDKFSIRQVYWPADKDLKNTLVIVSPWSVPEQDVDKSKVIKRFNFYDGSLAFYAIKL